jgi:hypothetical protein
MPMTGILVFGIIFASVYASFGLAGILLYVVTK